MGAFAMPNLNPVRENTDFDNLCDFMSLVEQMFIVLITILSRSAEAICHLCSLMLGQILSGTVRHLQHDLDESIVAPSQQVGVNIDGKQWFSLKIAARNTSLPLER